MCYAPSFMPRARASLTFTVPRAAALAVLALALPAIARSASFPPHLRFRSLSTSREIGRAHV